MAHHKQKATVDMNPQPQPTALAEGLQKETTNLQNRILFRGKPLSLCSDLANVNQSKSMETQLHESDI